MSKIQDVIVIGAGGAGLSTSYHLTRLSVPHLVLERGRVGQTWRSERWDSFHLVNPNWAVRLHGYPYGGGDPDGYLARDEVVDHLARYAGSFKAPVREDVPVHGLHRNGAGYLLETDDGPCEARHVVVATGAFGEPHVPAFAEALSPRLTQLHSSQYRNPDRLPPGGVLVVGSAQSGHQVADELHRAGRTVFLSLSRCGRRPRRYRGRDSSWWNNEMGAFDRKVSDLPSPAHRFGCGAHVSGARGGDDGYLRAFARDGITLLGRLEDAEGERVRIAGDLLDNLAFADEYAERWRRNVDRYIAEQGLEYPPDDSVDRPYLLEYPKGEPLRELDLADAGISTVIWATGFRFNFSWIDLPVMAEDGYPAQERGVTPFPGLYFMGLQWMYSAKSAQFIGVGEDAAYVAGHIAGTLSGPSGR